MNHLLPINHLANRYFAMRHGQSMANIEQIIVSHPRNGIDDYGLSEQGVNQVRESIQSDPRFGSNLLILSSDFKRARQSAEIAHELLGCVNPLCFDERLRERHFGEWELTPDSAYPRVWARDEIDPDNSDKGVESPNQVMQRVSAVVYDNETKHSGATILMVSHGDALQILQTAFSKQDASNHRRQQHLQTAEIRRFMV